MLRNAAFKLEWVQGKITRVGSEGQWIEYYMRENLISGTASPLEQITPMHRSSLETRQLITISVWNGVMVEME